jgi:hypothetical protein
VFVDVGQLVTMENEGPDRNSRNQKGKKVVGTQDGSFLCGPGSDDIRQVSVARVSCIKE